MSAIRSLLFALYTIWLFLAVTFQFVLLYFILKHSPKNFRIFKWLLANCSICQLVTISCSYCSQFGIVTNVQPLLMESFGFCRFFDPRVCFITYLTSVLSTYISNTSILGTFYFKFRSVKTVFTTDAHVVKILICTHIPAVLMVGLTVWFYQETIPFFEKIAQNPKEFKNEDSSIFAAIPDTSVAYPVLNLALATSAIWHTVICSYLRKQILREVNTRMLRHSLVKRAQHRTFVMGLTIQVIVPSCLYPMAYAIFYFYYLNGLNIPVVDLYNFILIGVPPLIDPMVCLYFVTPFRKTAREWMGKPNSQVFAFSKAPVPYSQNKQL